MTGLETLVEATIASSVAILLVLLLRRPLRKAFGARLAYGAWGLVPVSLLAVLLPAAKVPLAPASFAMVAGEASSIAAEPGVAAMPPGILVAVCWIAGLLGCWVWMAARQMRFRRSLGPLQVRTDGSREAARDVDGLPATLGLWMPMVVVPPAFDLRYDAGQRELMLAHERAHVRRGDLHANAIVAALRCLFWFNPLIHAAAPRFRHDQELACDATVLARHPAARRRYGEALLHAQLDAQSVPLGCHFGFGHPLKERIDMLREQLPSVRRRMAGTVFVSTLACGLGFAAWAAQPPQAVPPPAPETQPASEVPDAAEAPRTSATRSTLPPPKYPAYAAEHHLSGNVVLIVDVAADGSVSHAEIERSEPKGIFDEVALAAVQDWKFNPATEDGVPVAGRVRVPVDFRMDPDAGGEAMPN